MFKGNDTSSASGTIYGVVTDYVTGEPLSIVNVKLRPTGTTTLTWSDGMYQFDNVSNNKYTFSLSKYAVLEKQISSRKYLLLQTSPFIVYAPMFRTAYIRRIAIGLRYINRRPA